MAKLTDDVQTFLVRQLACFLTPSEVAAAVAEDSGVEIGGQQAWKYRPANNPELAPKWRALFEATRAAFIADVGSIAVAHKSYRMRQLDKAVRGALAAKRSRPGGHGIEALRPGSAAPSPGGRGVRRRPHQPAGADRQGRRAAGHDL